jgi:hypothetical protein
MANWIVEYKSVNNHNFYCVEAENKVEAANKAKNELIAQLYLNPRILSIRLNY